MSRHLVVSENYKYCVICNALLPLDFESDCCPRCEDEKLFREVREYIRENNVTEYMVSDFFEIPVRKVREWIRQGRIEYVETAQKIVVSKCSRCGAKVSFGTLCINCLKLMNESKRTATVIEKTDEQGGKMRFLDFEEEKK